MNKAFATILLIYIGISASYKLNAQVTDNFSDANLDQSPTWFGLLDDFVIENEQLKLNGDGTGKSYLSTKAQWKDTTSWEFWFKMDFAPSTSNLLRIYLSFNNSDLSASGNGYFIEIGESGSVDNLELYRQTGTTTSLIAEGSVSTLGATSNECRLKVTRSKEGDFEVNADFTGGINYDLDISANDKTHSEGDYFGFFCSYTSTRADKFFFDDVRIDPIFKDTKAPELVSVAVIDNQNLELSFNEPIDSASAVDFDNYDLNGDKPSGAAWNSSNAERVGLTFSTPFVSGNNYLLKATAIKDVAGNALSIAQKNFLYYQPAYGDLIINEVFPDPTPTQGLPEQEFVELYNATNVDVQLAGWSMEDASSSTSFDSIVLKSGEYLIVCPNAATSLYSVYGKVLGVSLPALNNSGDDVVLKSAKGEIIDKISYASNWYNDPLRSAGGFSIERISQITSCSAQNNWKASQDANGGTPGKANSVLDNSPDLNAPQLEEARTLDGKAFVLLFNEPVDSTSAVNASYNITGVGAPSSVFYSSSNPQEVRIEFENTIASNTRFDLEINGVEDCEGNLLSNIYTNAIIYVLAQMAELHDVLITEIMADPDPVFDLPAAEFIELTNVSDKVVNVGDMRLKAGKDIAVLDSFILFPNETVTICKSTEAYLFEPFGKALGVSGFPGLSNGGELLELRSNIGDLIHFIDYNDSWYGNDTKADGGFSLEMIDTENPCGEANNWTGAKGNTYGTPGQPNSVAGNNADIDIPFVANAIAIDSVTVELIFNEICDSTSLTSVSNYVSVENLFQVTEVESLQLPFKTIRLKLDNPISREPSYLMVYDVKDCAENSSFDTARLVLPGKVDSFDIVINEVLFNPQKGGYDFIELTNNSDEFLNLRGLQMANRDESGALTNIEPLVETNMLLDKGSYVAFTENREDISSRYTVWQPENLLLANIPSMPDNEGIIVLLDADTNVIDELHYLDDWHYPLLKDDNGYSLERIKTREETQNEANWATCGLEGATPTRYNSHFKTENADSTVIQLSSESFSPDNDGFEDKLQITIRSGSSSQSVSIKVFDLNGSLVRNLVGHEVIAAQSLFAWNGFNDQFTKAPVGVYIFLIELVDLDSGTSQAFKRSVVLKGRL